MKKLSNIVIGLILLIGMQMTAQANPTYKIKGRVICDDGDVAGVAQVFIENTSISAVIDNEGYYAIDNVTPGTYTLVAFAYEHTTEKKEIIVRDKDVQANFHLHEPEEQLKNVTVQAKRENHFGMTRLSAVEGMGIYEGKKSEVLNMEDIIANKATNNARQVYGRISGLNIWESDGAGIQLGVGGRGLSPNRSSNFNTRQNGVDMSADALGYPESYYSPPIQAVEKIQIVRGAASLQYGTQFGGLINFKLKEAPTDKKFSLETSQSGGSYGFFNSYNQVGGTIGKFDYISYYQFRRGDGWRENSEFDAHNAYTKTGFQISDRLKVTAEYSFMYYMARQPGGLTDQQFDENPQLSYRDRNWFKVRWNLPAVQAEYSFNSRTKIDTRFFGLVATREALGNLDRIDRPDDPLMDRTLLDGDFKNIGNETRILHRYTLFNQMSSFLGGIRLYSGNSRQTYGPAPKGSDPDFYYNNLDSLYYDYDNGGKNLAIFAENIFTLNDHWSVTPGFRYENIVTTSDGYYQRTMPTDLAGNPLLPEGTDLREYSSIENPRDFILLGVGVSYKPSELFEVYANFSQNYKSISYSDIRVTTPTLVVDQSITDESGYSLDLGARGSISDVLNYEVTAFMLMYRDRIGSILMRDNFFRVYRYQSNVGDARNIGLESFFETDILRNKKESSLTWFLNLTLLNTKYIKAEPQILGNRVEFSPIVNLRSGLAFKWKKLGISTQISYMTDQYTDATNASNDPPVPGAVEGTVPAYYVADISAQYQLNKWLRIEGSVNNFTDSMYFTRRATGYPGPGIIPSDGRTFYLTLTGKF